MHREHLLTGAMKGSMLCFVGESDLFVGFQVKGMMMLHCFLEMNC